MVFGVAKSNRPLPRVTSMLHSHLISKSPLYKDDAAAKNENMIWER
ncbi:13350_t:CDS:2 [Entrophospora sp. SA101]|nr:13350_t:CDS:2 [Entrophospora sp. SA101]